MIRSVIIIVMGAAGAGKTTIGRALAAELGWQFVEGDDYHTASSIGKMHAGIPLTDVDRAPWLASLARLIARSADRRESIVVACSALKESYRDALRNGHRDVRFVYLRAPGPVLRERLLLRGSGFFNPSLVPSQIATLEEPQDPRTVTIDATLAPEEILGRIRAEFGI